ncbi:MAG TPA: histidinol-phosphatase HisJ family protein [Candidatus Eisenbacteria bacterium]|uniref:Histidinol-phosphatase n=1 Tax=Eiseniibacteriota bacterium TaxID=2212470 RepID=A0A7V2AW27_UNCEI|nr:histidinol-phosphatase HisJ family protein [Candidatus Eisenbacteria bacterium]
MIDYHLHGNFCGHARGALEEYVSSARAKGFREIGFSAHLPKVIDPDPYHAMLEDDLPRYVDLVHSLQRRHEDDIVIRLGIEADYFPGYEEETERLLAAYPFDYVLGSVHFLDDWHFTSRLGLPRYETEDPAEVFPRYYELLGRMIRTGLFDIAAHADAITREYFRPRGPLAGEYRKITGLLGSAGMAIEVNTAGLRRGAGSIYPNEEFLRICVEGGVPLTLGSDAHSPEDVGRDYDRAFETLQRLDVQEIATYEARRMRLRPLSDFNVA